MQVLQFYYTNILKQDFITKFNYLNCMEIPFLEKVVLRFNVNPMSLSKLLPCMTGLFMICSQKPYIVHTKGLNVILQIKSGTVVSCKVDLRSKEKYCFLHYLIFFILPRVNGFFCVFNKKNISFRVENIFLFKEIEKDYEFFPRLPRLNVEIFFKAKTSSEIFTFLNGFKFPTI